MKKVAFVGGWVFDSDAEKFIKANVICEDGFITDITTNFVSGDYEIVKINGKYMIPGMIDVHTHGIGGFDFNFANEDEVRSMRQRYAQLGTTSVMATLASDTMPHLTNSIFAINQNRVDGELGCAGILGIHLEGRYLNPEKKGAHALELLALPSASELEALALTMMPQPVHASIAPELEGGDEFIKKANELGVTIGIAHTNATYEQACHALELGAVSFTHTFNAMASVHHRMPGAVVCALTSDIAYAEIIPDGHHLHPAIVNLAYKAKKKDKLVLITDSLAAAGSKDGEYTIAGTGVIVKDGVAINEHGVLAGSTLTMFNGVKNVMKFCNISLCEALKFATINPANMVKADFVGKLASNYKADFILINDINNPEIDSVYVGAVRVKE